MKPADWVSNRSVSQRRECIRLTAHDLGANNQRTGVFRRNHRDMVIGVGNSASHVPPIQLKMTVA